MNLNQRLYDFIISRAPEVKSIFINPELKDTDDNSYISNLYKEVCSSGQYELLSGYTLKSALKKQIKNKQCLFHQHWMDSYNHPQRLRVVQIFMFSFLFRAFGGVIIWTVHNKAPHDSKNIWFDTITSHVMGALSSFVHVHSGYAKKYVHEHFGTKKSKVIVLPHPNYHVTIHSKTVSADYLKSQFNLSLDPNRRYFLMFGQVRPYKGVQEIIDLFFLSQKLSNHTLIIAGRMSEPLKGESAELKADRVIFLNKSFSQLEMDHLFSFSDCCIFNFTDILTSGSIQLALDYKKNCYCRGHESITETYKFKLNYFSNMSELETLLTTKV